MAAKKYYVVWSGLKTGVFETWAETAGYVQGVAGSRYKSYPTRELAERALAEGAPQQRAAGKAGNRAGTRNRKQATPLPDTDVVIYSDGGCDPNPGPAGSGLAVYRNGQLADLYYGRYTAAGTNNTAELNALYEALLQAKTVVAEGRSVTVLSDSTYAINCVTKWAEGWKRRGWKRKDGEIKNLERIQSLYALYQEVGDRIELRHVKAHAGTEGNELADRMTMVAVDRKEPDFVRYPDPVDITQLLKLRSG